MIAEKIVVSDANIFFDLISVDLDLLGSFFRLPCQIITTDFVINEITGDAKLKKSAMRDNIKVSGLIFVLENLIEYQIIDKERGADKLEYLMKIN